MELTQTTFDNIYIEMNQCIYDLLKSGMQMDDDGANLIK